MKNKETLEEAAKRLYPLRNTFLERFKDLEQKIFIEGAKWQQEQDKKLYSEEEVINALHSVELKDNKDYSKIYNGMKEWFKQLKNK